MPTVRWVALLHGVRWAMPCSRPHYVEGQPHVCVVRFAGIANIVDLVAVVVVYVGVAHVVIVTVVVDYVVVAIIALTFVARILAPAGLAS